MSKCKKNLFLVFVLLMNFSALASPAWDLARNYMQRHRAEKLEWNWGPAVFLYGLEQYLTQDYHQDGLDYLIQFHQHKVKAGLPKINWSDMCPPALSGLLLLEDFNRLDALPGVHAVAEYIQNAKRNKLGALDHLGTDTFFSKVYPSSIWVDSLMMYGIFAARWGKRTGDKGLVNFAAQQPLIFASVLQDPKTKLFAHAWNNKKNRTIPKRAAFWLRGNAWVLAASVDILEAVGFDHPHAEALKKLIQELSASLAGYQRKSGLWRTVVDAKRGYEETSGSLLVAYAMAKAARLGILSQHFRNMGKKTFDSVTTNQMQSTYHGQSLRGISWFTLPSNRLGYLMVPLRRDLPYGVGAYLLAAAEFARNTESLTNL